MTTEESEERITQIRNFQRFFPHLKVNAERDIETFCLLRDRLVFAGWFPLFSFRWQGSGLDLVCRLTENTLLRISIEPADTFHLSVWDISQKAVTFRCITNEVETAFFFLQRFLPSHA